MKRIILESIKPTCLFEGLANVDESVDDTGVIETPKKSKKEISSLGRETAKKDDDKKKPAKKKDDKKKDEKKSEKKDDKKKDEAPKKKEAKKK